MTAALALRTGIWASCKTVQTRVPSLYYFELSLAHKRRRERRGRHTCVRVLFNFSRLVSLKGEVGRCNSFVMFPYQTRNSDLLGFYIDYISRTAHLHHVLHPKRGLFCLNAAEVAGKVES